jgi:hypothetical protein
MAVDSPKEFMMNPILSIAIDAQSEPSLKAFDRTGLPVSLLPLGDPKTMLLMCHDGTLIAVRYTTAHGLLHDLQYHTLLPTVAQLRDRSKWCYLIISGNLHSSDNGYAVANGITTRWQWTAVQGALLSIQELGVAVIHMQSEAQLHTTVQNLAKRNHQLQRMRIPKEPLFTTPSEEVLLSLPGIGDERCDALLRFAGGNAARALECLTDPAMEIPSIGPDTKTKARQALGLSEKEFLAVVPVDVFEMTNEEVAAWKQ